MKFTIACIAAATIAAFATASQAASIQSRYDMYAVNCTGQFIVGTLKVRNPDNSLHPAAFVNNNVDSLGRPKLVTKFNGVPVPQDRQFAFQVCNSNEYNYGRRLAPSSKTGFLSPNNHRDKAVTLGNVTHRATASDPYDQSRFSLVDDTKASQTKFSYQALRQFFNLYNNGTFYSLAFNGREGGLTAGFAYGPLSTKSSDGQSIFVEMQYSENPRLGLGGYIAPFGYALEIHP
ncbi:hypothetical protein V8E36_002659 [Tilletia maclaganii]